MGLTDSEIVVKDLSISIGNRELLSHADFQLRRGRHYVLHGRNGIGKSTLLRAMATDQIPSIPRGVKVLLLGQTQSTVEDQTNNLALEATTVLQYVIRSDVKREQLLREAHILSQALGNTSDPTAAVKAYRKLSHERLERRVAEARQIALRRSGARGARSRITLNQLEEQLATSEAKMIENVDSNAMSEDTQKAAEMLAEVQTSLELVRLYIDTQWLKDSFILRWMHQVPKQKQERYYLVSDSPNRV